MSTTYAAKKSEIKHNWYIVDASDLVVGRISTEIATTLRGKNKPIYTPNVDCGDYVIVINAEKVKFTGKKMTDKIYYRHTGHPGGIKETTPEKLLQKHPERILEHSIRGMLPKSKLGRAMYKKLYIYQGNNHPHEAQNPQILDLKKKIEKSSEG